MATYTTNLDLKKPETSDKIRIADINNNMDDIDAAFGAVGETPVATQLGDIRGGMAIVSTGNAHDAIAAGQFVYVMNHDTLDDGLYTADSALAANATLSSSNLTVVSGGGLNALNSNMANLIAIRARTYAYSCSANGLQEVEIPSADATMSGYTLVAITAMSPESSVDVTLEKSGSSYYIKARNYATSAKSGNARAEMVFVKGSL